MRELLWVQLAFDLAMLFALLALERSTRQRARGGRAAAADGLGGLAARAGRGGLAAEPALRRRLARFRERAG
jgi:hypothetical protein